MDLLSAFVAKPTVPSVDAFGTAFSTLYTPPQPLAPAKVPDLAGSASSLSGYPAPESITHHYTNIHPRLVASATQQSTPGHLAPNCGLAVPDQEEGAAHQQSGGAAGLNPNATPFQFSSAAEPFQPSGSSVENNNTSLSHPNVHTVPGLNGLTADPAAPQQQAMYQPYLDMMATPYSGGGGQLYSMLPGGMPNPSTHPSMMLVSDEMQVLLSATYRAKVLPPPLPLAMHNKIWARNVCELDEDDHDDAERGTPNKHFSPHHHPLQVSSHHTTAAARTPSEEGADKVVSEGGALDGNTSEYSFSDEDPHEKTQRLQAYKNTMARWFRHIQILESKPEVSSRSSGRRGRSCKSYEEMLMLFRPAVQAAAGTDTERMLALAVAVEHEMKEVDEELVLRAWSDECVRWWQESSKRKPRKARKKKPEEMYAAKISASGPQPQPLPPHPPHNSALDAPPHTTLLHHLPSNSGLDGLPLPTSDFFGQAPALNELNHLNHHAAAAAAAAAAVVGATMGQKLPSTYSSASELQFNENSMDDDDEVSDALASELLLQFED